MNNKIPKVYVNNIEKINNNKSVFYSYKDKYEENILNKKDVLDIINNIFSSNNFIYKRKVFIKTNAISGYFNIISRNMYYLLTLDGIKIYIDDILEIRQD